MSSVLVTMPIRDIVELDPKPRRGRGRPRHIDTRPVVDYRTYNAEIAVRCEAMVVADQVVQAAETGSSFDAAVLEIAREAAYLALDRQRAVQEGKEVAAQISSRRVAALAQLATLVISARTESDQIPAALESRLLGVFVETIRTSAEAVLPTDTCEMLVQGFLVKVRLG